jgi:hypothetical protein
MEQLSPRLVDNSTRVSTSHSPGRVMISALRSWVFDGISSPSSSRKKITILWTTMQGQMREFDHHDDLDVEVARVAGVEYICVAGQV